ncbi:hypothetical protein [Goodfellowiella coeruleoviolacea]|uniref:hypothetical protein n=1 Tax=Goodfellowiella coeruleoviolacea TaxID=334858 RepID=UPI0020A306A5|nr:hypothetical protein [Goodfellowiella coeruleoviolacea]
MTIVTRFQDQNGEYVPLRVGQHDYPQYPNDHDDGFGVRHIQDGHNEVDTDSIASTMILGECIYQSGNDTHYCAYPSINNPLYAVVYTLREDWHSGDGEPVGIITAYPVSTLL